MGSSAPPASSSSGPKEVVEGTETFGRSAAWIADMRDVDSMFTALEEAEVDEGLARLRSEPDRLGRVELSLLVFTPA